MFRRFRSSSSRRLAVLRRWRIRLRERRRALWSRFKRSFDEHPIATLSAVVGLLVLVLALVAGVRELVKWINGPGYRSATSRLIIIDASASMGRRFSPERKYDAAMKQVLLYVKQEPADDVALRFTNSRCNDSYAKPPVFFVHNHRDQIEAELTRQGQSLHGETNLSGALRMGLNDFHESKTASGATEQSIWLFLGTPTDVCQPGADVVEAIKAVLDRDSEIKVSHVDFFALKTEQKTFEQMKDELESLGAFVSVVRAASTTALHAKIVSAARREAPSH
jgi:hypothetical protein